MLWKDSIYGCIYAAYTADNRRLCPFCRSPAITSDGELMERINKRVERDDFMAIHILGGAYNRGVHGVHKIQRRQWNSGCGQEA